MAEDMERSASDAQLDSPYRSRDYDSRNQLEAVAEYLRQFSNPAPTARLAMEHVSHHGYGEIGGPNCPCAETILADVPKAASRNPRLRGSSASVERCSGLICPDTSIGGQSTIRGDLHDKATPKFRSQLQA